MDIKNFISIRYFSWQKWLILAVFLFGFTFLLAYFTGLTGESKQQLLTRSSLLRRGITAVVVGFLISFINHERKQ